VRASVLVFGLLAACGGATVPTTTTTTALTTDPKEPLPDHVDGHLHSQPTHFADLDKLYIEVSADGDHGDVLRKSATMGLASVPYAVSVEDGGDLELHVELASLTPAADNTACKVKIFALRLPQHDLLAIADGGAKATGSGQTDTCLSTIGATLVKEKLPSLFEKQLEAKH
jgi:hypothetical protein